MYYHLSLYIMLYTYNILWLYNYYTVTFPEQLVYLEVKSPMSPLQVPMWVASPCPWRNVWGLRVRCTPLSHSARQDLPSKTVSKHPENPWQSIHIKIYIYIHEMMRHVDCTIEKKGHMRILLDFIYYLYLSIKFASNASKKESYSQYMPFYGADDIKNSAFEVQ